MIHHTVVTGIEVSEEASNPVFAFGIGASGTNLLNPNSSDPFTAATTDPRVVADTVDKSQAVYGLDTLSFGDDWKLTLGLRWDRFDTDYDATRYSGPPTPFNDGSQSGVESFDQVDEELSYRVAVVAELNDSQLSLGVALFQIEKTNARVPDPMNPGFNTLGGEQRVRGLSVDAGGALTDRLYLSSGYAYLDGEVTRAAPGAAPGAKLATVPEHSLSVWIDYLVAERFDIGLGARYVSEQLAQSTGAGKSVPSYSLFDAMARYRMSDTVTLKLNLANLTDEFYFDQLHPWHAVPGAGFTATSAVNALY